MIATVTARREAFDHPTGWRRYAYSTNHKDIGTMYLFFAVCSGLIGATFPILMRMELQEPGLRIFPWLAEAVHGASPETAIEAHMRSRYGLPDRRRVRRSILSRRTHAFT
jgi:cytochrome c oxidase subunit 1